MIIETERLVLREYTFDDFNALFEIVSDSETMQHYPAPFDENKTKNWIAWNLENYQKYGFGLWAVVLKESGEFIGDCGITIQNIDSEMLPEIGYHIHKKYWRNGIGRLLVDEAEYWFNTYSSLENLVLTVFEDNIPAINLYQQLHFVTIGKTVEQGRNVLQMQYDNKKEETMEK